MLAMVSTWCGFRSTGAREKSRLSTNDGSFHRRALTAIQVAEVMDADLSHSEKIKDTFKILFPINPFSLPM